MKTIVDIPYLAGGSPRQALDLYHPDSPKTVTFCPGADHAHLPERIPFYLRQNCFRMPRERAEPQGFSKCFPCPFDLLQGKLIPEPGTFFYQSELVRV